MDQGWLVEKKQIENVIVSCGFLNNLFQAEIMQSVKKGLVYVFARALAFNLFCFPVYMWEVKICTVSLFVLYFRTPFLFRQWLEVRIRTPSLGG